MLTSPTDFARVPRAAAGFVRTVRSAAVWGVSAGVLLAAGFGSVVAPAAHAAPGTPGVTGDPVVLFTEDFENRAAGSNIRLDAYTGTTGQKYTAMPSRPPGRTGLFRRQRTS
jgi:hypothetical protein